MKKNNLINHIIILTICSCSFTTSGQGVDSLKMLLAEESNDSTKVKLLKKIGDAYFEFNFDSTEFYYNKVLAFAPTVPHYDMKLSALRSFGYNYFIKKNNYPLGLEYFNKALDLTKTKKDSIGQAYSLADLGWGYWKKKEPLEALKYHLQVKSLAEELQHPKLLFTSFFNLGIIQNDEGDNKKAIEYFNHALEIADTANYVISKGRLLNNLGKAYQDDKEYDIALQYFQRADSIFLEKRSGNWLSLVNYNKGNNFFFRGDFLKSISYFQKALEYNKVIGNNEREAMILLGLAKTQFELDDPQQSITHAERALTILKEIDTKLYYKELYLILGESYDLIGDYYKASEYFKKYLKVHEEEEEADNVKKIATLNHNVEIVKKENRILDLQNKDLVREKTLVKFQFNNQLLRFATITIFLCSILFFFINKSKELKRMDDLKNDLSDDLHDNIGSSLNHIKMLSNQLNRKQLNEKERGKVLLKIKNISNEMMHSMYDLVWALKKNQETVGDLIVKIQDHADNALGDFNIPYFFSSDKIDEQKKLSTKEKLNIYAIFKEGINNILKHTDAEKVYITLKKGEKKNFIMQVKSIYKYKKQINKISNHNGIVNMKKRAKEINGELETINEKDNFILIFSW